MNYEKIGKELLKAGLIDERMIVCHAYRSYTQTKDYGILQKYNNFQSSIKLPSFMLLSIKENTLYISYAKAFGGFKKYYASIDLLKLKYIQEIIVDKVVKIYMFKIVDEYEEVEGTLYIIGLKNKENVKNLVNNIIYNKAHLDVIDYDIKGIPEFKYISKDAYNNVFYLNKKRLHCQCCGKVSEYLYTGPFYDRKKEELDTNMMLERICPECIHTGRAATEFNGQFIDEYNLLGVPQEELKEVIYRTPAYNSLEDPIWNKCCNSPSVFLGIFGWSEIIQKGLEKDVIKALNEDQEFIDLGYSLAELKEMLDDQAAEIAIYRCPKCLKYSIQIYFD